MLPRPLPSIGEVVSGKYRIDALIGEGGMGVVLGAMDLSLNRPVAIKFLTPARASNPAAAQRFAREARSAASIQSEHVVRVYEVGALPDGAPFIVMEHLRGADLAHVIGTRGGLPVHEACDLVLQSCEALGEAHARGIVHRDLKPQNLFLTQKNDGSPCLKVLDFGISKSSEDEASSPKLTATDMVMGTPLYMSPEQVRSLKNVDARADIWALGAILHELLTASPPFDGPTASALHAAIAMDTPASIAQRRPDVSPQLEAVVLCCLEKDPVRRFQDVGALAEALHPFASDRGRQAASRIANVVRTARGSNPGSNPSLQPLSNPPAPSQPRGPVGMASTMNVLDSRSATNNAWQQASSPAAPASNRNILLGVGLAVLALIVALGGGALVLLLFFGSTRGGTVTVTDTRGAGSAAPVVSAAALVTPASSASVDAGAPAPPPPPPPPPPTARPKDPKKDEDKKKAADAAALADKKRMSEQLCSAHQRDMSLSRSQGEPAQKSTAERVRTFSCGRGSQSPSCERANCRDACMYLKDNGCLQRLEAISHIPPPY